MVPTTWTWKLLRRVADWTLMLVVVAALAVEGTTKAARSATSTRLRFSMKSLPQNTRMLGPKRFVSLRLPRRCLDRVIGLGGTLAGAFHPHITVAGQRVGRIQTTPK